MSKRPADQTGKRTEALDRAVRKLESREKAQDDRTGKTREPVKSIGRDIRQGRIENA